MISDYLWVVFAVLVILIVLYYILGLLLPVLKPQANVKQQFGSASPGTFDQLGARNLQDRYQLVM